MTQVTQRTTVETTEPKEPGAQVAKRTRILVADSDGFTRMVLMLLFRMVGFGVDFTANGTIALRKLNRHPPDAILVELKLSGLPGLELIREVLKDPRLREVRIYVFTDVELLKKPVRKEVMTSAAGVFDKRSISRENVVKAIVADLTETIEVFRAEVPSGPEEVPAPQIIQPGELDEIIEGVSAQSEAVVKSKDPLQALESCRELLSRVCSLGSCAKAGGLANVARQSKVLEGLLSQLCNQRKPFAKETLGTLTRAVDVLGLLASGETGQQDTPTQFSAVIIDESPSSSQRLSHELGSFEIGAIPFGTATRALEYLESHPVDLVIANVALPELHGLELDKIRQLPLHAATSVIFVSDLIPANPSLEAPAASAPLVNRNPLLLMEIIMKSLNELQSKGLRSLSALPGKNSPSPAVAAPETAESQAQAAQDAADEFLNPVETLQPQDPFVQQPDHLPVLPVSEPEAGELALPSLASQPGGWVAERTVPDDHARTVEMVEQDPFAMNVEALPGETAETSEGGEAAAESEIEAAPDLSGSAMAQEPPAEPQPEASQHALSNSETPTVADWMPVLEGNAETGCFAGAMPEMVQPVAAAQPGLAGGAAEYQSAAAAEPAPAVPEPNPAIDEQLQALEGECAQLREAVASHDAEREMLVTRMLTSEGELHNAQVQIEGRDQTIANLQKELEDLKQQHANAGEPAGTADQEEISHLEEEIDQGVAALARTTAELSRERGERQRIEERAAALNLQLQQLHAETGRLLEAQRADQERIAKLEAELRQRDESLARRMSELEQEKVERLLAVEELEKARELNAQFRGDLSFFKSAHQNLNGTHKDLQSRLATALESLQENPAKLQQETAERRRLAAALDEARHELETQSRKRETLETEQQSSLQALREAQSTLQQESAERQRLKEALDAAEFQLRDRFQRAELELSQAQSALQFEQLERKRAEAELARVRRTSLDAARGTRLLRNTLRRQIRGPVDNVYHATRNLLQFELGPQQKKVAEGILQDALLVYTRLQEPTAGTVDSNGSGQADAAGHIEDGQAPSTASLPAANQEP